MGNIRNQISILGDSISTFQDFTPPGGVYYGPTFGSVTGVFTPEDTWWMKVIHALDGDLLVNNSWSGSTVTASGMLGACSPSRIRKLARDGVLPDIILIYTGLNDVSRYVPIEEFHQDYTSMLAQIRQAYPKAQVLCGTLIAGYLGDTPFEKLPFSAQRRRAYNETIRNAAQQTHCQLIDLAPFEQGYSSMDGLHPNGVGMEQLADFWLSAMGLNPEKKPD